MKYLRLFENISSPITLKEVKYLYDSGYSIDYDIQSNGESIGKCEVETIFKNDDFDDRKDRNIFYGSSKFDHRNPANKSDFDTNRYIVHLHGFKIFKEYRGKGFGYKSMELILKSIGDNFPKNDGVYLSVLKNNSSAINIYSKLGFVQVTKYSDVIVMKKSYKINESSMSYWTDVSNHIDIINDILLDASDIGYHTYVSPSPLKLAKGEEPDIFVAISNIDNIKDNRQIFNITKNRVIEYMELNGWKYTIQKEVDTHPLSIEIRFERV